MQRSQSTTVEPDLVGAKFSQPGPTAHLSGFNFSQHTQPRGISNKTVEFSQKQPSALLAQPSALSARRTLSSDVSLDIAAPHTSEQQPNRYDPRHARWRGALLDLNALFLFLVTLPFPFRSHYQCIPYSFPCVPPSRCWPIEISKTKRSTDTVRSKTDTLNDNDQETGEVSCEYWTCRDVYWGG